MRVLSKPIRSLCYLVIALASITALSGTVFAQTAASQIKPVDPSRWNLFGGYSFFAPRATVRVVQPDGSVGQYSYKNEIVGADESFDYFLTKRFGLEVESGQQDLFYNTGSALSGISDSGVLTVEGGMVYRIPKKHLTPYVHLLGGSAYVGGPSHEPYVWGPGVTAGGGLDLHKCDGHFSIRLVQVDYEWFHADSLNVPSDNFPAGPVWRGDDYVNGVKISSGVDIHGRNRGDGGCSAQHGIEFTCSANPVAVFPGDPVTVTGSASNVNAKQPETYNWSTPAGPVKGSGASVTVSSQKPGSYTITGHVSQGSKPGQSADCTTSFLVHSYDPPTVACSASPSTLDPSGSSTITADGRSPQGRQLSYSYSSAVGSVSGSGTTATLSAPGAQPGTITVICNVTDDLGQTATASTLVTVVAPPPPPPIPVTKALSSIGFYKDQARPTRVDNEAKASLDDIALNLQHDPDAKLALIGNQTADETKMLSKHVPVKSYAAQRAVNTKDYLVNEKGIEASRIMVYTGETDQKIVTSTLIPAGATLDTIGLTSLDESKVKPVKRKPIR